MRMAVVGGIDADSAATAIAVQRGEMEVWKKDRLAAELERPRRNQL